MSKFRVKAAVGIVLALVLLISMTTLALADGSQFWYLDSETSAAGYQMEKVGGPGDNGQTGNVTVAAGSSEIWLADQAAVCNVTFSGGLWIITICTDSDWGEQGDMCEANVGGWNTVSGWYNIDTSTAYKGYLGDNIVQIQLQADPATILQGDYLALKIQNNNTKDHKVITNGCSFLSSPCGDPGYPVVEIVSGVLAGLGLVGLAGYAGWRRRKASAAA